MSEMSGELVEIRSEVHYTTIARRESARVE